MVDIFEVSAVVAAAGILVGVAYYILDIRYSKRAREMELCQFVTSDFNSEQGIQRFATMMNMKWKDYEDFIDKYGYSNPEMLGKWYSQFAAWEYMGVLIKDKVVTAEKIYATGCLGPIFGWEKFKDIIQRMREVRWGRDYLSNAEFLAQEMLKIKMKKDASFKDMLETYRKSLKPE